MGRQLAVVVEEGQKVSSSLVGELDIVVVVVAIEVDTVEVGMLYRCKDIVEVGEVEVVEFEVGCWVD